VFEVGRLQDLNTEPSGVVVSLLAQRVESLRLVERHGLLKARWPDLSVELGRLDPGVPQQAADLLQVVVLLVDLHRHAVAQVVRLQHRVADDPTVGPVESLRIARRRRG